MSLPELFIIAVGLSMDAFAVAVCKGLSMQRMNRAHAVVIGLYFGFFQAIMPLAGYYLGYHFKDAITSVDHWIAFILLFSMLILAVATSIDALAVGVTFAFLKVRIAAAVSFIGIVTFLLSIAGVWAGNLFGAKYKARAEIAGGIILILMGAKILIEHLFF